VALSLLLAIPRPALAHPLGNFTVNHYTRLELYSDRVRVRYVLDMAEVPTFQAMADIDTDQDGHVNEVEGAAYRQATVKALRDGLRLQVDGQPVALSSLAADLAFPPGQADLQTLRLSAWFEAPMSLEAGQTLSIEFHNHNPGDRLGWHEVVVQLADGLGLEAPVGQVNTAEISAELSAYPEDMLASPLDQRAALFSVVALAPAPAPALAPISAGVHGRAAATDAFAQLIHVEDLSPAVVAGALLAATLYGALHAFTPGHGKAMVGAYLVGSRGTPRHALLLGLTVTVTHTLGVYLLGTVTLLAAEFILPERLYPILGALSGGMVAAIGLSLFLGRLRAARRRPAQKLDSHHEQDHEHAHGHGLAHDHDHGYHHHHGPGGHQHLPASGQAVTMRGLLALGISGGLIPCPTALLLMLGAVALNRVAFGLVLIVAFSSGLALVLTATGLLLVYAGRLFERLPINDRAIGLVGAGSALLMALVGLGAAFQAVLGAGL
jgi:ABC-type nickel/cobalt efflux system permease component RcnA